MIGKSRVDGTDIWPVNYIVPSRALSFSMESPVMSDHQLRFKGPSFDFDAKGWIGILAAIVIVGIVAWLWH
jgi:hypothetical protein